MDEFSSALRLAELRSREGVSATIVGVESVTRGGEDLIDVTYEFTDETADVSIQDTDSFSVPAAADDAYAFVRLCRAVHVPLEDAHEALPDTTVPVTWTGDDWRISLDDDENRRRPSLSGVFDANVSPGLAIGMIVAYPVIAPLLFVHLWPRRGVLRALLTTVLPLAGWGLAGLAVLELSVLTFFLTL